MSQLTRLDTSDRVLIQTWAESGIPANATTLDYAVVLFRRALAEVDHWKGAVDELLRQGGATSDSASETSGPCHPPVIEKKTPDYEAAAERLDAEIGGDIAPSLRKWPTLVHDVARAVVDAALVPPESPEVPT